MDKVAVIGCGGHAKVVIDVLKSAAVYEIAGYITPSAEYPSKITSIGNIGTYDDFKNLNAQGITKFIVAIGNNRERMEIYDKALSFGLEPVNAISPFSYISEDAVLGKGTLVMHGAIINPSSYVGDNCIINTRASVDHDCNVLSHSHLGPGCILAGTVSVKTGAFLGAGSTILPERTVGEWAVCGAGCVVTKDVEPFSTVIGVPAKKGRALT